MTPDRRRLTLDERTDRLARRRHGYPLERDTYAWAFLRLAITEHDAARAIRDEVLPILARVLAVFERLVARLRAVLTFEPRKRPRAYPVFRSERYHPPTDTKRVIDDAAMRARRSRYGPGR